MTVSGISSRLWKGTWFVYHTRRSKVNCQIEPFVMRFLQIADNRSTEGTVCSNNRKCLDRILKKLMKS
jgi:hypothetical protein